MLRLTMAFLAATACWSCGGRAFWVSSSGWGDRHGGSCESTCDYYQHCKKDYTIDRRVCLEDCGTIFSDGERLDQDALVELQNLACPDLLFFIEGNDSRPLNASMPAA